MTLQINTVYGNQRTSTATGMTALKDMTQAELLTLAIQAQSSHDSSLTRCFIDLPSLIDLKAALVDDQQVTVTAPDTPVVATPAPAVMNTPTKPTKSKQQIQDDIKAAAATVVADEDLLNSLL